MQRQLRLLASRHSGQSLREHRTDCERLNRPIGTIPAEKLFADLLKRHARDAMNSTTACDSAVIDAHLERCREVRAVMQFAVSHGFVFGDEGALSGLQLSNLRTVADHIAALDHTLHAHRAPCVTPTDALERIERKLDLLAGMVCGRLADGSEVSE